MFELHSSVVKQRLLWKWHYQVLRGIFVKWDPLLLFYPTSFDPRASVKWNLQNHPSPFSLILPLLHVCQRSPCSAGKVDAHTYKLSALCPSLSILCSFSLCIVRYPFLLSCPWPSLQFVFPVTFFFMHLSSCLPLWSHARRVRKRTLEVYLRAQINSVTTSTQKYSTALFTAKMDVTLKL